MGARKTAPLWKKVIGGVAATAMLVAISSVNIWPSLKAGYYQLALAQIAFTVTVAISRYIPVIDPVARSRIVMAFMIINGCFAFQAVEQLRDDDAKAHRQYVAWKEALDGKDGKDGERAKLRSLGEFQATKQSQIDDARAAMNIANADGATARKEANEAQAKFTACRGVCNKLKGEAERLEGLAKQKETDAKTGQDKFQELSRWGTLTEQAKPINTQIAELEKNMREHPDKGEDSTVRMILQEVFALILALVIELANRYAPSAIFAFIAGLPAIPETEVEPASEPIEPTPEPSPKSRAHAPKSKPVHGIVISMEDRAKVVRSERFKGVSEQKIADTLGWTKSMVHRARHYHEPVRHGLVHAAA